MKPARLYVFGFLVLLFTATAWAQTGTITGRVTDDDGVPIPGATVTIQGTRFAATASGTGEYTIPDVPAGEYTVQASTYSYKSRSAQVVVSAGQTASQDFTLQLDLLGSEEVVVTGTTTPERKIESSTAISTLNTAEINESAPRSTTEFLRRVPGFTRVESSGGEVNQNISVRGLLGVESVNIEEDGMQVYPTMHVFFMNADNLIRPDENLEQVQIVRGGTSAIFGSSTAGATLNLINKVGGDEIHGVLKGTGGQRGLGRFDFNMNGPLTDEWRFNVGGFYRYDGSVRDADYPAVKGGQFKANISRVLSNNGFFKLSAKYIDDQNLFILPLPYQNPDDPQRVSGFSSTGAYHSKEGVDIQVPLPTGEELTLPLDEGINTQGGWLTGNFSFNIGDDWQFENTAQLMSVDHQWNAIAPGAPLIADEWAQGEINRLITAGILPAGSTYQLLYTNHFDPVTNAKLPFSTPNGLVAPSSQFHVDKPISSFSNKLLIRKLVGDHKFSIGNYFAYYTQENGWYFPNILMDVRDNPRFLDLVAITPDGQRVDITKNGFRNFLATYVNASGNNTLFALFASDEFAVNERLRIDVGIRYERQSYFQVAENTATVDLDNDPNTVFDIEQFGNNTFRQFEFDIDDVSWSGGVNYQLRPDQLAIYGSVTRGFRMPALDEFMFESRQELVELFEPQNSYMVEAGVKYSGPTVGYTVTAFWGKVFNVISRGVEFVDMNPVFVTRPGPDSDAFGFEIEFITRPTSALELRSAATLIDVDAPAGAQAGQRYDGFTPAIIDFEAAYEVAPNARVLFDWHYVGERFSDPNLQIKLEDFAYINLGGSYAWPDSGFTLTGRILNLTNSDGFEEGDPRVDPTRGAAANFFNARPLLPIRVLLEGRYEF